MVEYNLVKYGSRSRHTKSQEDRQLEMAAQVALIPECLKKELVFPFNTIKYKLREVVGKILGVNPSDFHRIHELEDFQGTKIMGKPARFHKRWSSRRNSEYGDEFRAVLGLFVEYEVKKALNTSSNLIYQKKPVLRAACPSDTPLGHAHRDEQYYRPPFEINIWVPLNEVFGTNTLWAETERGKGDFHPFSMTYGNFVRFYGHQCLHMTKPNDTNVTRVSLDFRVVPEELYTENYLSPYSKEGETSPFSIGKTYTDTETERKWRMENNWPV